MSKLRRITVPILLVAGSWYYEVRSYQPPSPTPASTDLNTDTGGAIDWVAVLVRATIAALPYLALETVWSRRYRWRADRRAPRHD